MSPVMPVLRWKYPCFSKVLLYYIQSTCIYFPNWYRLFFYKVMDFLTPGASLCHWSCCPSPGFIFLGPIAAIDWITSLPVLIRISARVSYWKWQSEQIAPILTLAMGPQGCLQNKIHISYHALRGLHPKLFLFALSHLQLYSPYTLSLINWSVASL